MNLKTFPVMAGLVSASTFFSSSSVFADTGAGQPTKLLSCINSTSELSFEIRNTAVPTYIQGLLAGSINANFACAAVSETGVPSGFDIPELVWECKEVRSGVTTEGSLTIVVTSGGVTGLTIAKVNQDQVFPLPPLQIETLVCK